MTLACSECGAEHDLGELSFAAPEPEPWHRASEADKARSELTRDRCILRTDDETSYFVAAVIDIPIVGSTDIYTWGVWVSLSERSFREMDEHWDDPARVNLGPYFGWLCTSIPEYPETLLLKTMVHQRDVGLRPSLELEPTDHPLAVEQREGIERAKLTARLHRLLSDVGRPLDGS